MGKKPVVGLVGLCWFGLALSGCKDCDCGKDTRQAVRPTQRKAWDGDATSVVNRPRSVQDNSASIAGRGGDPSRMANQYDQNPKQYDVSTPPDQPPGGQEPAGMPVSRSPMMKPAMQGTEDMSTVRTSQPPADAMPARQPAPVHEVTTSVQPEKNPVKDVTAPAPGPGGEPEPQPAAVAPMSGGPAPVEPMKSSVPPVAVPVTPGAAAPPMPVDPPSLSGTSGPIAVPPPSGPAVMPTPPPVAGPAVESTPKSVESSLPLAPSPSLPPPPVPGKN